MIDVKQLMRSLTQEELLAAAEAYYSSIPDPTFQLAKPFASVDGCPALLEGFAKLLRDGRYLPGHRVLEFGAGSCWAGRLLNQLGMAVTSLDVSPSALALGQRLAREQPVVGRQPPHDFLIYDGTRIDRPDRSFDRIFCFDAFHHVANPEQTLAEFARVLDDGGIASFSEPGPRHSLTAESQREMRDHKVIENDIVIEEVWEAAQAAGFTDIRFSLQTEMSMQLGFDDFRTFRQGGLDEAAAAALQQRILVHNRNVTVFHLVRGALSQTDSRTREGLVADIKVEKMEALPMSGGRRKVRLTVLVRNISGRLWRRSGTEPGCVNLGVRQLDQGGQLVDQDYFRHRFLVTDMPAGESALTSVDLPIPAESERAVFELEIVSEGVCWFSQNGSRVERLWT
jgi:SAM-dependent methyltransferase